jgi:hypothetical protein
MRINVMEKIVCALAIAHNVNSVHQSAMGRGADMDQLILKRASASRPSGEWGENDYDVLADGKVVGRIVKAAASPAGKPWMWTVFLGHHEDRTPTHGYEPTREAAGGVRQKLAAGMSGAGQAEQATRQRWPPPGPAPKTIIALSSGWLAIRPRWTVHRCL